MRECILINSNQNESYVQNRKSMNSSKLKTKIETQNLSLHRILIIDKSLFQIKNIFIVKHKYSTHD
jgi:hypothetical protein